MISPKHLQDYCLLQNNNQSTCRYLGMINSGPRKGVRVCLKLSKRQKKRVDESVAFLLESKDETNLITNNIQLGDNCMGLIILKYLIQE